MELAGTVAVESDGSPQGMTRHETELSAGLSADFRCVAPTAPLGAHAHPMRADANLSQRL